MFDAPPDKSWRKTICDAPPKIINEVAKVSKVLKPSSIPIAPNIIPKGITGINNGNILIKHENEKIKSYSAGEISFHKED